MDEASFILINQAIVSVVENFESEKLLKFKGNRYQTFDKIWELENFLLRKYRFVYVITDNPEVKLYITVPYAHQREDEKIVKIWDMFYLNSEYDKQTKNWQGHSDINLPAGSLSPQYVVVGIAPGYHLHNNPDSIPGRTLCYGASSWLIRQAMFFFSNEVWFTNLSKSSILNNKNDSLSECYLTLCLNLLKQELTELKPQKIICLGSQIFSTLSQAGFTNLVQIYHPAYLVRNGLKKEWYIEHIQQRI